MQAVDSLSPAVGVARACEVLGVPRSRLYRSRQAASTPSAPPSSPPHAEVKSSARALTLTERRVVRDVLNAERFADCAPREVYATLLDEGVYHCSWRTMYRILTEQAEVRERRDQARHPSYTKPELLATAPNQLWSWDITQLRGPSPYTYFALYVMLDVFSRYVVGWMIAERQTAALAEQFIAATCAKHSIERGQLTIHADRGSAMTAKEVAQLMADLGVTKSHSRPHVSNDNPFSEAQFKTLKYRPDYPDRFGCAAAARTWGATFFAWYNDCHHHTALALLTPADVHWGRAEAICRKRQQVLEAAFAAHPERFVQGQTVVAEPPTAVWINPPAVPDTSMYEPISLSCPSGLEDAIPMLP
jgi:putative transposase